MERIDKMGLTIYGNKIMKINMEKIIKEEVEKHIN